MRITIGVDIVTIQVNTAINNNDNRYPIRKKDGIIKVRNKLVIRMIIYIITLTRPYSLGSDGLD